MRLKDRNSRSRLETREWKKFLLLSQSTGQKEISILISKHKTERKKFLFSSRSTRRKERNSCSHHESLKQLLIGHCMVQTPAATWWLCFPHHLTSCSLGFALTLLTGFPWICNQGLLLGFADLPSSSSPLRASLPHSKTLLICNKEKHTRAQSWDVSPVEQCKEQS